MGDLFGGSEQKSEVVRLEGLTEEQRALLDKLNTLLVGELGKGMEPYPGEIVPGADILQERVFDWASALAPGAPGQQLRESALADLVAGRPSFERTPESMAELEDYYRTALVEPSRAAYEDELSAIAEKYAGLNLNRSGSFADALGRAASGYYTNLAGQKAGLVRGDIVDERQAREAAYNRILPAAQAYGEEELRQPTIWAQAGAARRGIERELAGESVYDWMVSQPAYNPWLGYMSMALGVPAYQWGTYTTGQTSPGIGPMLSGVGGLFGQMG